MVTLPIIFSCVNLQLESWTKFKKMRNFWQTKIRKICETFWGENPHCILVWSCSRMSEPSEPLVKLSKTTKGKPLLIDNNNFSYIFNNQWFFSKCCFVFINTYMIYTYICIPFLTVERYLPNTIFTCIPRI